MWEVFLDWDSRPESKRMLPRQSLQPAGSGHWRWARPRGDLWSVRGWFALRSAECLPKGWRLLVCSVFSRGFRDTSHPKMILGNNVTTTESGERMQSTFYSSRHSGAVKLLPSNLILKCSKEMEEDIGRRWRRSPHYLGAQKLLSCCSNFCESMSQYVAQGGLELGVLLVYRCVPPRPAYTH